MFSLIAKIFMWVIKKFSKKALKKRAKQAVQKGVQQAAVNTAGKVSSLRFLMSFLSMFIGSAIVAVGAIKLIIGLVLTVTIIGAPAGIPLMLLGLFVLLEGMPWAVSGVAGIMSQISSSLSQGFTAPQMAAPPRPTASQQNQQQPQQQGGNAGDDSQQGNSSPQSGNSGNTGGGGGPSPGMVNAATGHAAPVSTTTARTTRSGSDYLDK